MNIQQQSYFKAQFLSVRQISLPWPEQFRWQVSYQAGPYAKICRLSVKLSNHITLSLKLAIFLMTNQTDH